MSVMSLVMAGLTNYVSLLTYPSEVSLIGASGLVYWMAGFWLSMYLVVERSVSPGKRVLRVVCLVNSWVAASLCGFSCHSRFIITGPPEVKATFREPRSHRTRLS